MTKVEEILLKAKQLFDVNPATPPAPVQTEATPAYTLADGTPVEIDKLEVGGIVMVAGLPAAEGEHELSDGTKITTDANGVITLVTPKVETPTDLSTPEAMRKAFEKFAEPGAVPDIQTLATITKALFENVFGWQLRESQEKATRDAAIVAYQTKFTAQEEKIGKQDQAIQLLLSAVESLAKTPVSDPVAASKNAFSKTENREERFATIGAALRNINK